MENEQSRGSPGLELRTTALDDLSLAHMGFKFLFVMPHLNCIFLAYRAKKAPDPNAPLPPLPFHLHPPQKQEMKKERLGLGVLSF